MDTPVLVYHKVDNEFEYGLTRVSVNTFRKQIKWLSDNNYKLVNISDIKTAVPDEKVAAVTFDDAYESVYTNAYPILKQYGYTATVYVITDYIGKENDWDLNVGWKKFRHLNSDHIKELVEAGWEIGSHTCSHRDLRRADSIKIEKDS